MDIATGLRKVRRYVSALSLGAMLVGMLATGVAAAATYQDVPSDAWFYTYVEQLAAAGILDTTKTKYEPARNANRAEAAKLLVEAAGLTIDTSAGPSFTDVAPGAWYYQYVETAAKNGLVSGYKDAAGNLTGKFGPGNDVTREEFAKMAVAAFALAEDTSGAGFPDVPSTRWSYNDIMTLWNWSVVDGYPDGIFGPGLKINRAEIAKMLVGAMNPVKRSDNNAGAFTAQSAAATSATMVEVQFSMDVEETSGAMAANYSIKDAAGNVLAVSKAEVSADMVTLTTATQIANKPYVLTISNVKSANDKDLDQDTVNFNGYNPVGPGGPLTVSLNSDTPAAAAAPKGASGIVFTCWDFTAGSDDVMLQSLTVHRVGPGKQTDLQNVYLYNGADRITTGRSINSSTQAVEFSNINQSIEAGGVAKICLVGDFAVNAESASEHSFQLVSATDITTNASSVTGTFPLAGNMMRVAGGTVGTVTITKNSSLDQGTVGQKNLRFAQFQLQTDSSEDQTLQRIALNVRGSIRPTDVTNAKLYSADGDTLLAEAEGIAANGLITFVLDQPYEVKKGSTKIFYATADVTGRNGDDIKTYLDENSDLLMVGKTFQYGVQVNSSGTNGYNGADPNSTPGDSDDKFSYVSLKGSSLTIAFNGPVASDIAIGQQGVHCMDLTLTNATSSALEIEGWQTKITSPHLYGTNGQLNLSNIRLVSLPDSSNIAMDAELPSASSPFPTSQTLTFSGTGTIPASSSIDAAIIFDVSNQAVNGDTVTCTLEKLSSITDSVLIGGNSKDALTGSQITPDSTIVSNNLTISSAALTVDIWNGNPPSSTYTTGTQGAALLGLSLRSGSAFDNTIKEINLQGYVDGDVTGPSFSPTGISADDGTTNLKDIVDSLNLFNGTTALNATPKSVEANGLLSFKSLQGLVIPRGQTINVVLKGNINNAAPYGAISDRIKFGVPSNAQLVVTYGTGTAQGLTLSSSSIAITTPANNGGTDNTGSAIMTITSGGTGTTGNLASSKPATVLTGEAAPQTTKTELARWRFTSNNETPKLSDIQVGILNKSTNGNDAAPIANLYLYKFDANSNCTMPVGSTGGYSANGNGIFNIENLMVDIPNGGSLTLCALATINQVASSGTEPLSGSNIGAVLLNVTEVQSSKGTNVSDKYSSNQAVGTSLTADVTPVATDTLITVADSSVVSAGDVVVIDQEMMLVFDTPSPTTIRVARGFANTTPAMHLSGRPVGKSYLTATASSVASRVVANNPSLLAGDTCLAILPLGTGINAYNVGDIIAVANAPVVSTPTSYEYMLVTSKGICSSSGLEVKRGMFGSAVTAHPQNSIITRFPLHGNLSTLRRSMPVISLLSQGEYGHNFALPGTQRTTVLGLKVTAVGQDFVNFDSTLSGQIQVTLGGTLSVPPNAPGRLGCVLSDSNQMSGGNDYASTNGAIGLNTFNFNLKSLQINPGQSVNLYVLCDLTGVQTTGDSINGSLIPSTSVVQWNEGPTNVLANSVTTDGNLVITNTLQGPPTQKL